MLGLLIPNHLVLFYSNIIFAYILFGLEHRYLEIVPITFRLIPDVIKII